MKKTIKDKISEFVMVVMFLVAIVVFPFVVYFFVSFILWISNDPMDMINIELPKSTVWEKCVRDADMIFDNFNDTVGASYALEDLPSQNIKDFMEFCLEQNK